MLLFPQPFRVEVRCCFNHFDTSGVALLQRAVTRLNGAPPQAMLPLRWVCPGKLAASQAKTLSFSPMGHCAARQSRSSSRMSNAEKPTGACAWCMEPAFGVVVPVGCASSVNGMAGRQQSRGKSVCSYIRSRWVRPHCSGAIGVAESTGAPASSSCDTNAWR
jgi:hypothetical protein